MTADCAKCDNARQRAKVAGHREWQTDFVCWDHAAVSLETDEWRAQMAAIPPEVHAKAAREMAAILNPAPVQRELFA